GLAVGVTAPVQRDVPDHDALLVAGASDHRHDRGGSVAVAREDLLEHLGEPLRGLSDPRTIGILSDPLEDEPDAFRHLLPVQLFVPEVVAHGITRASRISGSAERSGSSAARGRSIGSPSRWSDTAGTP